MPRRGDHNGRALARALDALAEKRRAEVWDRLLTQLNELAEKEALRRTRAARFIRHEEERERGTPAA